MAKHEIKTTDELEAAIDAQNGESTVAVAVTDLDHFAEINESLGRDAGDAVLRSFERTLSGSLPKGAVVARVGGDEYAAVVPGYSAESAVILFEEIRSHFSSREPAPNVDRRVGVSAGIASRPPHATTAGELLRAAHDALMRAKREGRSRIAIYVEEKMTLKSNYYSRASLERLSKLSGATGRTEASLLREALDDLFEKHRESL